MSDFGEPKKVVGRKDYRCAWCGQKIAKGEKHTHFVGMWDSEWQDWRMHSECDADSLKENEVTDGFILYDHERPKVA
jgi:hypothetical protein